MIFSRIKRRAVFTAVALSIAIFGGVALFTQANRTTRSEDVLSDLIRFKCHISGAAALDNTWAENGDVFYLRSMDLYNEAICRSQKKSPPSETRYGVVVKAVKLEDGYWHLTLKD